MQSFVYIESSEEEFDSTSIQIASRIKKIPVEIRGSLKGISLGNNLEGKESQFFGLLDEIFMALYLNLIDMSELLYFLDQAPTQVELVLTGRYAPIEIQERADLDTNFQFVKHYFDKGIKARLGIEY